MDRDAVLEVPGNFPYKERLVRPPEAPTTREGLCILCGTCAAVCPTAAVVVADSVITEPERCLVCQACVKNCPTGARVMEVERIQKVADWLSTHCRYGKNRKYSCEQAAVHHGHRHGAVGYRAVM